jgi:hypothetical protein
MQNPLRSSPSANNESCSKSSNLSPGIFFQFFSEILSNFPAKGSFLHLKKVSKENLKSIFISGPLSASAWHCPCDLTRRPGPPSATASSLHCQLAPLVRAILPNPTMPCTHAPDAVPPSHPTVRTPTRLRSDQLHLTQPTLLPPHATPTRWPSWPAHRVPGASPARQREWARAHAKPPVAAHPICHRLLANPCACSTSSAPNRDRLNGHHFSLPLDDSLIGIPSSARCTHGYLSRPLIPSHETLHHWDSPS